MKAPATDGPGVGFKSHVGLADVAPSRPGRGLALAAQALAMGNGEGVEFKPPC